MSIACKICGAGLSQPIAQPRRLEERLNEGNMGEAQHNRIKPRVGALRHL
jgi:hypothetical protein